MMRLTTILALYLACGSCLSSPGDRAGYDEAVGEAAGEGLAVVIDDGLAAIRHLDAGALLLWSSAPQWSASVDAETGGAWRITIDNVLADAALAATGPDGRALTVTREAGDYPASLRFSIDLPAGRTRLRLTLPDEHDEAPFRFALLSDVQTAIDDVGDIFAAVEAEPEVRFLLGAGDLAQRGTRQELRRFQRELRAFSLPYYTTLGNHDIAEEGGYQELFGRGNFHFVFRGVHFTMLDSAAATLDPAVYGWLEGWLDEGRAATHVVAMHIPLLDPIGTRNGGFASRHEAGKILARLARGGVDLTLYGHIHSYYRFDNAGIPALISGGGGALPERFDHVGRHFLVIEVGADGGYLGSRVVEVDD